MTRRILHPTAELLAVHVLSPIEARKAGVRARGVVLEGVAHERIVRFAKSKRVDLVVMSTRGRSGLAKLVLGSVAERVVAAASGPVLTVRGK